MAPVELYWSGVVLVGTTVSKSLHQIEGTKTEIGSRRFEVVVYSDGDCSWKSRLGSTIESAVESATIGSTAVSDVTRPPDEGPLR